MRELRYLSLHDCCVHLVNTSSLQLKKLELSDCSGQYSSYESMFSHCTNTPQYLSLSRSYADDVKTEDESHQKFTIFFSASLTNLTISSWVDKQSLAITLSQLSRLRFLQLYHVSPGILENTSLLFSSLRQSIHSFAFDYTSLLRGEMDCFLISNICTPPSWIYHLSTMMSLLRLLRIWRHTTFISSGCVDQFVHDI
ncbi:hypothetical protein BT69DRAFT_361994 [Atractiella rhizophila]|nr:hypothetical protein BT69DRAFT_361994 [Atractiella rhizophila]